MQNIDWSPALVVIFVLFILGRSYSASKIESSRHSNQKSSRDYKTSDLLLATLAIGIVAINLLCFAYNHSIRSEAQTHLAFLLYETNLVKIEPELIDSDRHLIGTLAKELSQYAEDLNQPGSWLPVLTYLKLASINKHLESTTFVVDYLVNKYERNSFGE